MPMETSQGRGERAIEGGDVRVLPGEEGDAATSRRGTRGLLSDDSAAAATEQSSATRRENIAGSGGARPSKGLLGTDRDD